MVKFFNDVQNKICRFLPIDEILDKLLGLNLIVDLYPYRFKYKFICPMKKRKINLYRYRQLFEKCRKLQQRLTKALQSGGFYDWSKRKQWQVQKKLERYNRQLNRLKGIATTSMKMAALSASLCTVNPQIIQAQDTPILNPFGITTPNLPHLDPEFVDIDGDGDLDLFISSGSKFEFSESNELLFYLSLIHI